MHIAHVIVVVAAMIVSILLILVVLLQSSKGSGLASAFGIGMGATQVLGVRRTADILSRTTTYLAVIFMLLCVAAEFTTRLGKEETPQESIIQKSAPKTAPTLPSLPSTGSLPKDEAPAAQPSDSGK
ncbi:MAG: preprotein translocase subunit SecG [[Chlorobium] sp. 445]|nr:MAG: preprotein translocase subunit SecG [[Chlorobium] sp. 445]